MDTLKIRPEPKSYPGVFVRTTQKEIPFDYHAFMKSFVVDTPLPKVVKEVIKVDTFDVRKLDYITIPMLTLKTVLACEKKEADVTGETYPCINRMVFMKEIQSMIENYPPKKDISCDSMNEFALLPHQQLVQRFMKIDTPYRGLLLYHGLGSGKTCSSIAIAEALIPYKEIVVMTPASLETNYVQELKKCGSAAYRLQQHWVWTTNPTPEQLSERCMTSQNLIRFKGRGLWITENKEPNYETLTAEEQTSIQGQIDLIIRKQYRFVHYNGLRESNFRSLTANGNPFSNKVVIIDEAHNFVSRIVNQIGKEHISMKLYDLLMRAEKCKLILLTGTPLINYAHEVGILFNMLRGYIPVWSFDRTEIKVPNIDMLYYSGKTAHATALPEGFVNKGNRVEWTKYDTDFEDQLEQQVGSLVKKEYKLFPDTQKEFEAMYIQDGKLKNKLNLMFRMSGLASYFPDLTQLMPTLKEIVMHPIVMSKTLMDEYTIVRDEERKRERVKKPDDDVSSTYRIHSRLLCNTTYPKDVRALRPGKEEDEIDTEKELRGIEPFFKALEASDYLARLREYSPKYEEMARVLQYTKGLHLIYSQFLTIEGIAMFSKVLNSKGYAEFRLKKTDRWRLDCDITKPMYVTYIGTKSQEEKELIRNIFNKNWIEVPDALREEVKTVNITIFMITSAGAEGISLKEVQYVHVMEPYWNPVRIDQVVGRARRICSHNKLPEKERFVEVHMYLMTFPEEIHESLRRDDVDGKPGTTDEYLYTISQRKRTLNAELMDCIRKSSIDVSLYDKDYLRSGETDPSVYSYYPDPTKDVTTDKDIGDNMKERAAFLKDNGERVALFYPTRKEGELNPLYNLEEVLIGYINKETKQILTKQKTPTNLKKLISA